MNKEDYFAWLGDTLFDIAKKNRESLEVSHMRIQEYDNHPSEVEVPFISDGLQTFLPDRTIKNGKEIADILIQWNHIYGVFHSQHHMHVYWQEVLKKANEKPEIFAAFTQYTKKAMGEMYFLHVKRVFPELSLDNQALLLASNMVAYDNRLLQLNFDVFSKKEDGLRYIHQFLTTNLKNLTSNGYTILARDLILEHYAQDLAAFANLPFIERYLELRDANPFEPVKEQYHTIYLSMNLNKAIDIYALEGFDVVWYNHLIDALLSACHGYHGAKIHTLECIDSDSDKMLNILVHHSLSDYPSAEYYQNLIHAFFKDFLSLQKSSDIIEVYKEGNTDEFRENIQKWMLKYQLEGDLNQKVTTKKAKI